ncbi:YwqG family protein [uncultured Fusobacterium sp.]|uniref:YwqG family protein n=1 Tax=uncultured Fusobacterium sp. TaxID=159267 RepID=UPI0015A57B90|nr:YwqG family protein [uncultured Fusobacterium sp.]
MGKKKLTEEELRFNEDIKKVVLDILEKNKKPMIKISLSDDKPNLFQSKFGGVPYLPKDMEVPKNKENEQFTLLAQINIEELPKNNIYPMEEGMLQFWILNDDVLGLDYDTHLGNGFKVVYYKEIDKGVTEEEVLEKYNPYKDEDSYFPVEGEFSLNFKLTDGYFSDSNDDFREIVDREMKKFHIENKEKYKEILKVYNDKEYLSYWDIWDILEEDKEIGGKLFEAGHKIGGFPNFTQSDIRKIGDYEILLLQIDSEGTEKNEIMWGDCGIANFFIREKDLKELNFDKVIYNWDCC